MGLIDFIDQAVKQIGKKQSQALQEFADGILNIDITVVNSNERIESEVADNVERAENANNENFEKIDAESEEDIKQKEKELFFYEKIANKNSRAFDDFLEKLNQVKVQNQQTVPQNKKQVQKINQKMYTAQGKEKISLDKKDEFSSMSQKYQNSAQYNKTIDADSQANNFVPYNKSLQLYQQKNFHQNPQFDETINQEKQKTASQILAELQELHKQRSIEKLSNRLSLNIKKRTRIIKMSSEMQDKLKEKKQKQAEERIKINVEFLEGLKMKPSKQSPSFKEFNNSPKEDPEKLKQSIRIKILKKTAAMKLDDSDQQPFTEERQSHLSSSMKRSLNSSNIFMESPLKLPQISERKGALKPKPYSVYNLSQRGHEMFVNLANK